MKKPSPLAWFLYYALLYIFPLHILKAALYVVELIALDLYGLTVGFAGDLIVEKAVVSYFESGGHYLLEVDVTPSEGHHMLISLALIIRDMKRREMLSRI